MQHRCESCVNFVKLFESHSAPQVNAMSGDEKIILYLRTVWWEGLQQYQAACIEYNCTFNKNVWVTLRVNELL